MSQKRAAYDNAGNITAFYDDSISPAPQGVATIPLTNDQWQACISNQGAYIVQNGALVEAPQDPVVLLMQAQAAKVAELSAACKAVILSGFESSALGTTYSYPAKDTDQQNLASSVLASVLPGVAADWETPFWCADEQGAWAFRLHTAAQIQQVGKDGKAAILAAMTKNQQLADQVMAAKTVADVQAITWA